MQYHKSQEAVCVVLVVFEEVIYLSQLVQNDAFDLSVTVYCLKKANRN